MRTFLFVVLAWIALILAPLPKAKAFVASCNLADQTGCPQFCPATANSFTPASIPNSGWTTPAGTTITAVDCLSLLEYNPSVCPPTSANHLGCLINYFFPHGATASQLEVIVHIHGGGWSIGGLPNTVQGVMFVQNWLDAPNAVGGRGIAFAEVQYRLSGAGGSGAIFPAQWQDPKCAGSYLVVNAGSLVGNFSMLGILGESAGATDAWWLGSTPDNLYTWNCSVSASAPTNGYRVAALWPPLTGLKPSGNSMWENPSTTTGCGGSTNCQAESQTAFEQMLNCTDQPTCLAADTALNFSMYLNINQTNIAALQRSQNFFLFGAIDGLVVPYWATNSGNIPLAMNAYNALSPPIKPAMEILPGCIHECDFVTPYLDPSEIDAMNFLLGTTGTVNAGVAASGVSGLQ